MNLADINVIREILKKQNFSFKKSLGQNFLINNSVCPMMAEASCDKNTGVLEIGPGIGVLTKELSLRAKKVVSIELDERLKKILPITLDGCDNVEIIYDDVMKLNLKDIIEEKFSDCDDVVVCANLPYYITSPIVMMLLESRLPIKSITVLVQKEAAIRLCADVGSRESGAVTVAVSYYSIPQILFDVDRDSFLPPPNVDSAVIKLTVRENPPITVKDEKKFFGFIKSCFAQRRKTMVNTVSNTSGINKDKIKEVLKELSINESVRSEQLTMEELANISNKLF